MPITMVENLKSKAILLTHEEVLRTMEDYCSHRSVKVTKEQKPFILTYLKVLAEIMDCLKVKGVNSICPLLYRRFQVMGNHRQEIPKSV